MKEKTPKPALPKGRAANPRYKSRPPAEGKTTARSLRDIIRAFPGVDEWKALLEETDKGSDRAVAIVLASQVERYLEFVIVTNVQIMDAETHEKLIERDGALSNFFSKIWLAYAMDLISKQERDDLNIIRQIRNTFAHAVLKVDFALPEIIAECVGLSLFAPEMKGRADLPLPMPYSRLVYSQTCHRIGARLLTATIQSDKRHALTRALVFGKDG